jgi:hypothetical protein
MVCCRVRMAAAHAAAPVVASSEAGAGCRCMCQAMITLRAAALAAVNMTSSVLIVLCNKILFKSYSFNYPLTLSLIHFLFTIAGVEACRAVGLVSPARISARAILPLSCAYVGFVVLTNIRCTALTSLAQPAAPDVLRA